MTGFRSKFKTLDDEVTGLVRFGDGSTVSIKGKGTVGFQCKNGEELLFHDVYFIPDLCNNIISLGQLSENGNKVILKEEFLWVYDGQERLVMKVQRSANTLQNHVGDSFRPYVFDEQARGVTKALARTPWPCKFQSNEFDV